MPIAKYTGVFGDSELQHLLKRSMFGSQIKDLKSFSGASLAQVLDTLLKEKPISNPPINAYNDASFTDPVVAQNQTWVNAPYGDGTVNSKRLNSFNGWWIGLLLNQEDHLLC